MDRGLASDAGSYSSDKSTNCYSCGTLKMTDEKGTILASQRIFTSSLGVIIAIPIALLLVAIVVLLVFLYAHEKEIAVAAKHGSADCQRCATREFNNLIGASACEKCLLRRTTPSGIDATGISQCICDEGSYWSDKSTNCHSCGTFKMAEETCA